jgi:hypothetical protein
MEMHNLPTRFTFYDHERDATIGAEGISIPIPSHGIYPSDDDRCVRQDHDGMIANCRTSRTVIQERCLEVLTDLIRFGNKRFAAGTQEKGIGRIELDNAIDIGLRECLSPFLQDPKGFLLWTSYGGRAERSEQNNGHEQSTHFSLL